MLAVEGASIAEIKSAYAESGLPANGIMVDSTIFRLLNGMSTYVLAAAVLVVAGLCVVAAVTEVMAAVGV
ncbi:MAG: hypothetical protein Q4C85_07475 [Actinomyces sp.]|nr:hypothetical protein [Actinomyces sp.]